MTNTDQMGRGRRIMVTGGAGFIGANVVRLLLEEGYGVTVLDDLSAGHSEYLSQLPVRFVRGSVLDAAFVKRVASGHEGIVHLAAQTGVPDSLKDPERDCEVNVFGTVNVLEAARVSGVPRVVFASSNATLGRQSPPASEDKAPLPISPYGASKLAAEAYCLAYHGSWGLGTIALRFANVYGPFSGYKESVVAKFLKTLLTEGHITIDGDGQQSRDFVYVRDLSRAILAALTATVGGEVFQIATGVETTIVELAAIIREVVGKEMHVEHGPARQGDIRKNYSRVTKAERVLGWRALTGLPEGIKETLDWFRTSYSQRDKSGAREFDNQQASGH